MTAFISIAGKPCTKRSEGLILKGAKSQKYRRDNLHQRIADRSEPKPVLNPSFAIMESLDGALHDTARSTTRSPNGQSVELVWTSESKSFDRRTARRRRLTRAELLRYIESQQPARPEFDEAGRPIVYKTDDAWNYRVAR